MSAHPRWERYREDLDALHAAALAAADPADAVRRNLGRDGDLLVAGDRSRSLAAGGRVRLVAFGKAACGMARAAIGIAGDAIAEGVIAHPHGAGDDAPWPAGVRRFAAGHPLPDEGSLAAGDAALEMIGRAGPDDLILVLVSGGGSALFEALREGLTLEDMRGVTRAVMHAGADIVELNTLRRALSRTKGGGLSRAAGARALWSLILSDVIGDPVESIASGPTIPARPPVAAAREGLERRGLAAQFPAVMAALDRARSESEPPSPGERHVLVVGSNRGAAAALAAEARRRGFECLPLTDRMQGEAREVGRLLGGVARGLQETGSPLAPPACLVLGGETTVTVRGQGRGGRNLELVLGAAVPLAGCPRTVLFSFATDGLDGSSGAAGAWATGDTLARAAAAGRTVERAFAESDSAPLFEAIGDLKITGASGTNVNDLVVILAYSA